MKTFHILQNLHSAAAAQQKCGLNIITFADGRKFISGNRCERGAGKAISSENESLYDFKYNLLLSMFEQHVENPKKLRSDFLLRLISMN